MKLPLVALFSFVFFCAHAQDNVPASIYDMKIPAANGSTIDLAQYKGKKILIVNTPYEGDGNPYYTELEKLSAKYKDKLVVIGCMERDFGIEPGSNKIPDQRIKRNYHVTFPTSALITVRGGNMPQLYRWLTMAKYNKTKDNEVAWDFQKYLIDEQGNLAGIYDPEMWPNNPQLIAAIEK